MLRRCERYAIPSELFGPIVEMEPEAETAYGSDPVRNAEEIVAALRRFATYVSPQKPGHHKSESPDPGLAKEQPAF